ncbi:cadherin-like beta sandwich domain-containing protein [Mucilaginibacter pedocola]|nr:cadherin-like beta sandwich domain-containing protein [Mucilaginibacter pedocola]
MTIAQKKHVALLLVFAAFAVNITAVAKNSNNYNHAGAAYALNSGTPAAKPYAAPVLSNLSVNTGTLSPAFNETITGYRVNLPYATNSIKITPTTTEPGATITVNEMDVVNGAASPTITLSVGINTIPVAVTTADGLNTNTYTVTVVRVGQAPNLSYPANSYVFNKGDNITPVVPTITGGAVPAIAYATTSTLNLSGGAASFQYNQFRATGICADLQGNLYMAIKNAIWKITPSGVVTLLVGQSTAGYADGAGGTVKFNNPVGMALDAAGNLYVGDAGNNRIRKVTPSGVVSTFAGSGTAGATNGTGTAASFRSPHGLAMDNAGNLFVADNGNNLIRKITPLGVTTTFAGSGVDDSTNGTGTAASFDGPSAIAADRQGNLYVVCINAPGLRKITSTAVVSNIPVGFGVLGVTADAVGNIYLTCGENSSKLYKIPSGGAFEFLAGGSNIDPVRQPQKADGVGTGAAFSMPSGIVADNLGNIYITDAGTDRIRKVTVTGFTINPALNGLVFNGTTGTLSGTASFPMPVTNYTISAINAAGIDTAKLDITVRAPSPVLSSLSVVPGPLSPAFSPSVTSYNVTVVAPRVRVTPYAESYFSLKLNGKPVVSGQDWLDVPLNLGANTITVSVTAQDSTVKTYTINVTRLATSTITLKDVYMYPDKLTRVGTSDNWAGQVGSGVSSVKLGIATTETATTFKINGVSTMQGTASAPIVLTGDTTVVPVEIAAEDGVAKQTITVTITRATNGDITLSKFYIYPGTLTYDENITRWTAKVSLGVESFRLGVATAEAGATIKINGIPTDQDTPSAPITTNQNFSYLPIEITAEDGVTKKTIFIAVDRDPTGDVTLSKFAVYPGTLVRTGNTDDYTVHVSSAVPSVKLSVATAERGASITVNNIHLDQKATTDPIALTTSPQVIPVAITAEDNVTVRTFNVTVIRDPDSSSITLTKLFTYPGELTRVGTTDTWVTEVGSGVASIRVGVNTAEAENTVKVNGEAYGYWKPIALTGTTTSIPVEITAKDGVTKRTFTVVVTKPALRALASTFGKPVAMGIVDSKKADVANQAEDLVVKQAVSPNGDDINDRLVIEGITAYPENTVKIMDRDGSLIYEAKGYDNQGQAFDGRSSKGVRQRAGTYFYSVEYKKGDEVKRAAGYLVIKY